MMEAVRYDRPALGRTGPGRNRVPLLSSRRADEGDDPGPASSSTTTRAASSRCSQLDSPTRCTTTSRRSSRTWTAASAAWRPTSAFGSSGWRHSTCSLPPVPHGGQEVLQGPVGDVQEGQQRPPDATSSCSQAPSNSRACHCAALLTARRVLTRRGAGLPQGRISAWPTRWAGSWATCGPSASSGCRLVRTAIARRPPDDAPALIDAAQDMDARLRRTRKHGTSRVSLDRRHGSTLAETAIRRGPRPRTCERASARVRG